MDNDESSDILGGRLQVSPPGPAVWADTGRITLLLGFATVVALTWVRIGPHFRQWRETRYRKAMRRRHGIPDDDHRPFNVAYAAALQARRGLEGKSRNVTQQNPQGVSVEDGSQFPPMIDAPTVHQDLAPLPPSVGSHSGYQNGHASSTSYNTEAHRHYTPSYQDVAGPSTSHHVPFPQGFNNSHVPVTSAVRTARPANGRQSIATRTVHGKHALDDETDAEPETLAKKSRVDGEELIDGEEEREWREDGDDMDVDSTVPHGKRGAKRMASPDDDEGLAQSRAERRDKRARKVSMDQSADAPGDEMDEDELEDDLQYIHDVARGKKRDRAEAGSTFGGDDSLIDDDEKPHRHRRRRVASNRVSQSSSRGQKRVRDLDSVDSDDSEAERPKREYTRKKRGKRSDEEIVPLSNDPLCGGRRIGDEWEANGVQFKVGPNGQRLRQELVKKSRTRFPMPSDSQHPDRRANVDVYVETWLTEEEYQSAKERHELAWQDAPPTPPEFQTPGDVPDSPSKIGKNLLWSSMASRESPARRGPLRQSIATNVGLRLSMLAPAPVSSNLRVSSVYQAPASPAVDSPKVHKSKSYSKWEKQDLEAAAMSKIREKQQLQRQLKAAPAIATQPSAPFSAPSAAPAAPKPTEKPAQSSTPSFGFPPASTPAAVNKCVVEPPKLNIPGSAPAVAPSNHSKPATPSFPFPASSGSAPSATATKPGPPPSTSVPNFFSKPADPAPTPVTAPTPSANGIPSFFAKPPQTSTPTGASAAPTPATAPKSTFSFAPTPTAASQATQQPTNGAQTSKPEEPKQAPGGSLLSRLGMGPPPSAQGPSSSAFGFGKPASTPASSGSNPAATASPFGAPAKGASSSESAPKFSFGAPSKPASSAPPPAPTTNGTPAAATSTPKFSFGVNNAPAQPAAPAHSAPAPSPFQNSATNASSAPKSAFGFGNSSTPASNPFGDNSNTAAGSSPFGAPSGTNASGANPSPFGGPSAGSSMPASKPSPFGAPANGSAKPSEAPKSAFSFGNNTTTPSAGTSMFGGAGAQNSSTPKTDVPGLKPTFSFASSSTPAFGGSSSTPTFGGSSTTSAFGGQSSTSAFGGSSSTPTFGAPSSTPAFGATSTPAGAPGPKASFSFANATGSTPAAAKTESKPALSFNFGTSNSTSSSGAAPAAPSPSAFGFGAQPSSTTPATPAASSPFGAPAAQSGATAFGFGAPSSGAFSFGSNAGQNTQK